MFRDAPNTLGILEEPNDPAPIGTALYAGRDVGGLATWRLLVRGVELAGLWIVVDREFRPASCAL
jgi:hypothetical protein